MKLIDVCELIVDCPHSTAKDEGQGIPLVRTPNIGKGRLELSGVHRVSETVYNQRIERAIPQAGDLILAREAPVGNVALIMPGQKVCLGQRVVLIRPDKGKADAAYLTYYLLSEEVQHRLINNANGAVVAHLNMNEIRNLQIDLPNISVQKRIAGILSSLDDRIALNKRINHNLEEQLDSRYAFLLRKSSQRLPLSTISAGVTDGVHNTIIDSPNDSYYLLSCKNLKDGRISIGDEERRIDRNTFIKLRQRTKLGKWDILLSSVGTIGEIVLLREEPSSFEFQRSVAMIKPTSFGPFVIYSALRRQKLELIHSAHGAVQQCLFLSDIGKFEITIPADPSDIYEFSKFSMVTHSLIAEREKQNFELITLRNLLLPKLLSGELVSDFISG